MMKTNNLRSCGGTLKLAVLGGATLSLMIASSAQAQLWPMKKKSNENAAAPTQTASQLSKTNTNQPTSNSDGKSNNGTSPAIANFAGPRLRLAVMNLNGSALSQQVTMMPPAANGATTTTSSIAIPPPADFARGLTEMLTTALVKTNRFVVLERTAVDKVVGEQDFGASGRVNKETAPSQGKIIGAQAIITGDITGFSYSQSSYGGKFSLLKGIGGKLDKVNAEVILDIRVVDAATGEVLASERSKGKASMSGVSADITQADKGFSVAAAENTPLGQATRQALDGAVNAIIAGMQKERWSAKVIDFRDGLVYINAGSEIGLQPGMELEVFRPQDALVDPETGQALGAPDRRIGSVIVNSVQPKYCVAKVKDGGDMKRNDVVRVKGDSERP